MSKKDDQDGSKTHIPVLLRETIKGLALTPDATVIDATLGSGGHFFAIIEKLGQNGTLLGLDVDPVAVAHAEEKLHKEGNIQSSPTTFFGTGNFREIAKIARAHGITKADAIVADLGWRMEQFSGKSSIGGGKGFSFTADESLLMTFGDPVAYPFVAADIVNNWREEDIATILKNYGEEQYAKKIAHAIVSQRAVKPIETATTLAEIVNGSVPGKYRNGRIHPATKTFQALRIAVNDELDALKEFIKSAIELLSAGGRLAIISFHSIEDRIVKQTMRTLEEEGCIRRITKKPITPTAEEIQINPRARSAKLRIVEKI